MIFQRLFTVDPPAAPGKADLVLVALSARRLAGNSIVRSCQVDSVIVGRLGSSLGHGGEDCWLFSHLSCVLTMHSAIRLDSVRKGTFVWYC